MKFLSLILICFLSSLEICSAQTLKVALFNKEPLAWEENGQKKGFHYEIVQALSEQSGIRMDVQMVPILRAVELFRSGTVDMLLLTQTKATEDLHDERIFLYEFESAVFTLANQAIKDKKELDGPIKLARVISGCKELEGKSSIQWLNVQSFEQGMEVMKMGRVRGFCSPVGFWRLLDKKAKIKIDEVKALNLGKKTLWLHVMPSLDKKIFKKIKDAAEVLVKSGRIEKIAEQYDQIPMKPSPPAHSDGANANHPQR